MCNSGTTGVSRTFLAGSSDGRHFSRAEMSGCSLYVCQ